MGLAVKVPIWLHHALWRYALRVTYSRAPDFVVPGYLERWFVVRSRRWGCIYVHRIIGSDDDRALHDHRSWNVSVVLAGWYLEHLAGETKAGRRGGDVIARRATTPHRISIATKSVLTLFLTGPHQREWGFVTEGGWVQHDQYLERRPPDVQEAA